MSTIEIRGSVERSILDSTFGENATLNFGDQYYGYSSVLLHHELYLIPGSQHPEIVPPSRSERLVQVLDTSHLVILSAPAYWRQTYAAEYLAHTVRQRTAGSKPNQVYSLTSEASGNALLDALRDEAYKLENSVILASSTLAEKYASPLIEQLALLARERGVYIILTTEQNLTQWALALEPNMKGVFFDLDKDSPYSVGDLTTWLLNNSELKNKVGTLGVAKDTLTKDTVLPGVDSTLEKIASELGSPGSVQQFLNGVRSLDTEAAQGPQEFLRIFEDIIQQKHWTAERRIEAWFNELNSSEKYLVLAISLLDGLRQETFWAIYEQLTQLAWRERELQLVMSDYHHIAVKLDQFVSATGDQVRFHNAEERRKLVAYALDGYRRSLVQALPVLADIVSGANQPVTTETGSLAGRLRILDIFGSELEPTGENRQRQERLRNSIANSIAQIAQREPATTQHLLLAWASGVEDTESDVVNTRLRIAVTITLVQMLTIEAPSQDRNIPWHERHTTFTLLNEWYDRYYPGNSTLAYNQSLKDTEERHRNIRGTMALALCHIGRHMTEADFGSVEEDESQKLLGSVPVRQPTAEEIRSPWHMLLALAWDPDSYVRASIIEGLPVLMQRHRKHAEALIILLASDWSPTVRIDMATLLDMLYGQAEANIYLTDHLLEHTEALTRRDLPSPSHYLRREVGTVSGRYPLHVWTATLAMFYLANRSEAVFRAYVQTLPTKDGEHLWALEDVILFTLRDDSMRGLFQDSALLYVFTDAVVTERMGKTIISRASQRFEALLQRSIIHPAIQRNTDWFKAYVGALIRGRWKREMPTSAVLLHMLDRVTIRDEGTLALIQHYISLGAGGGDDHERIRRRIQQVLEVPRQDVWPTSDF